MYSPFDLNSQLKKNQGNPISQLLYSKIISSFMYLSNYTKPNVSYTVNRLSRYIVILIINARLL